jgi:hypothetical protein
MSRRANTGATWRDLETEPLVADPVAPEDAYYR